MYYLASADVHCYVADTTVAVEEEISGLQLVNADGSTVSGLSGCAVRKGDAVVCVN